MCDVIALICIVIFFQILMYKIGYMQGEQLAFRRIQYGSDQGWCYLVKNGRTIVSGYEVYVG